jgi:hypothetical protein
MTSCRAPAAASALAAGLLCLSSTILAQQPAPPQTPAGRGGQADPTEPPGFTRIKVTSSIDHTEQDAIVVVPSSGPSTKPRGLAVFLHAWSVDYTQRQPDVETEADKRDWLLLIPNFRGRYDHPEACGSPLAQQDILDAIAWVKGHYAVDEKRVYALRLSGGAFMTMLMIGKHPEIWAAGSAWAGISDLAAWFTNEHATDRYATNMRACFGGAPSDSAALAVEYKARSPLTYRKPGLRVPLDLNAGKEDPTVAFQHTLRAFQALVPGALTEQDTAQIKMGVPFPAAPSLRMDSLTGRRIYLRREVQDVRLTIYDGRHEWFPRAAFAWLEQFQRQKFLGGIARR